MSDTGLRGIERALDLAPDDPELIERFILSVRRAGGFGQMYEGDEDRERASRRLMTLGRDRATQIEVALRSFGIPFKKVILVEGRSEWQFKIPSFDIVAESGCVMVDCAARLSEKPLGFDFAIHGDEADCVFVGLSTRRLVDFLANPKTVPPIVGSSPSVVFRSWRRVDIYRFNFNLSILLNDVGGGFHDGFVEAQRRLTPEAIAEEEAFEAARAEGARVADHQPFTVQRHGLDFQCDWKHSWCSGEFKLEREEDANLLDVRVVSGECLTVRNGDARVHFSGGPVHPGMLRCVDTGESQFWTAADLVEAIDAFHSAWSGREEKASADAFMKDMETLGVQTDDSLYSWFNRDKYDGNRYTLAYKGPDGSAYEIEFVETTSGTVQAKLWREPPDEKPVVTVLRTPRELYERLHGIFLDSDRVVF